MGSIYLFIRGDFFSSIVASFLFSSFEPIAILGSVYPLCCQKMAEDGHLPMAVRGPGSVAPKRRVSTTIMIMMCALNLILAVLVERLATEIFLIFSFKISLWVCWLLW